MKLRKKMNRLKALRFIFGIVCTVGFFAVLGIAGGLDTECIDVAGSVFALGGSLFAMICGMLVMKFCDDEIARASAMLVNARKGRVRANYISENDLLKRDCVILDLTCSDRLDELCVGAN